jgi:pimeloyl-ACP methyl ester carboxylesterase
MYRVAPHRHLGFAEYGDPRGRVVFWFHGTPGGRRQIAPQTHGIAAELGVRLILVERPGVGFSTPHLYRNVLAFADDIGVVADRLGIDDFACAGLSGGGPYTLACAARFPDRMVAGAVLGGVAPTRGPDAIGGGAVGLARRFAPLLSVAHRPIGLALHRGIRALTPLRSPAFALYVATSPEGDKQLFARPGMKDMFINDIVRSMRHQADAPVLDLVLFTRDWGFRLGDVRVPIRFWHGDADHIVPLAHVEHIVQRVPDHAQLHVRHGESHLGALDAADEIFRTLLDLWDESRA